MKWTSESSGKDAFDAVMSHMRSGPMKGADFRQCVGFQLWHRFLIRKPAATLAECLTEFELRMRRQGVGAWPMILLEAFGEEADAHVRSRLLASANGDAALSILSCRVTLSESERAALHERQHKGIVRLGKVAPPEARQPGRRR